eukprot:760896-Hanusia_phi.AAC.4
MGCLVFFSALTDVGGGKWHKCQGSGIYIRDLFRSWRVLPPSHTVSRAWRSSADQRSCKCYRGSEGGGEGERGGGYGGRGRGRGRGRGYLVVCAGDEIISVDGVDVTDTSG